MTDRFERTLARVRTQGAEVRDPSAATQNVRWTNPDMPMVADWDAETAVRWGYYANVIAFRCVQIRANALASLPFRAGPEVPTNTAEVAAQDYNLNAPLARLLGPAPGGPAPGLPARKLWAWTHAQRIVTGRNAWEIETTEPRGKGAVVALWPLVSASLKPYPTLGGSQWFRLFEYGRPDDLRKLQPEQVFYGWTPSLSDFRQPESAMQAARLDLSVAVMADRYSYSFLKNGATPAALVITREFATKAAEKTFRRQWSRDYQGPDNANKVAFATVEAGLGADGQPDVSKSIDVKVLGLTQKDAQFIEQHRHSLGMVAIALGVPWSKLDASGRSWDNASEEDKTWWHETMLADITTYQDEINMGLAPRVGSEFGWFDLSGVESLRTKPEPTTAAVGAPAMVQAQLMTIDEGRADYGLPPLPNGAGDRFMTAAEIQALTSSPAEPRGPEHIEVRTDAPATGDPAAPPLAPAGPTVREVAPDRRAPTAEETEQRRANLWKRTNTVATTLERQWERAFRRLFNRQQASTLSRLTGKRGRQAERRESVDPNSIFDPEFWQAQTAELADDLYEAVAAQAGAAISATFGIDFDLEQPEVQELIRARANLLAGQVTDTTYRQIKDALADGSAAGEDVTELAARVREVFEEASRNRSVVIARTEVVSAYNGSTARMAATLPSDVVAGQEWIATRDGRTRSAHAGADGQVRGIGQQFNVGGAMLAYPGDPNGPAEQTIQCRCTLALLTPEQMAELAERSLVPLTRAYAVLSVAADGRFDEARIRARLRSAA